MNLYSVSSRELDSSILNITMTLYLTYRPKELADVAGQDHIVTTLLSAVERDKLSHAYLFCGMRGTGKTSVARIIAKTILLKGIEDDGLKEHVLKEIENDSLIDLIEIDAASNRRIDDVRELIEKLQFSPVITKAKVYIIDEVHMLTKDAFNALLKTLEEPPPYAYFILATTELHKVPETIQSRCQRFLFKKVRDEDIIARLRYIAGREHIDCDDDALALMASHAGGSFRDAISLLDQLRSLKRVTLKDVSERTGNLGGGLGARIVEAIDTRDSRALSGIMSDIEATNTPIEVVLPEALDIFRKRVRKAAESNGDPLIYVKPIDVLLTALRHARLSPLPELVVESALVSLIGSHEAQGKAATPVRSTSIQMPPPSSTPPRETGTLSATLIQATELTQETLKQHWPKIVERTTPAHVRMSLKTALIGEIDGNTIMLIFPSAFHRDKVIEGHGSHAIEHILSDVFKQDIRIKCLLQKDENVSAGPIATDLAQAAQEVFGTL